MVGIIFDYKKLYRKLNCSLSFRYMSLLGNFLFYIKYWTLSYIYTENQCNWFPFYWSLGWFQSIWFESLESHSQYCNKCTFYMTSCNLVFAKIVHLNKSFVNVNCKNISIEKSFTAQLFFNLFHTKATFCVETKFIFNSIWKINKYA